MGCSCKEKNKKINKNTSTTIFYRMIDIVKAVPQYNMNTVNTGEVTDSEWKALLFVLYQISCFTQFHVDKKRKEFGNEGGCFLCYDSVINALREAKIVDVDKETKMLFLVSN
jgi:hypothetical protein